MRYMRVAKRLHGWSNELEIKAPSMQPCRIWFLLCSKMKLHGGQGGFDG